MEFNGAVPAYGKKGGQGGTRGMLENVNLGEKSPANRKPLA